VALQIDRFEYRDINFLLNEENLLMYDVDYCNFIKSFNVTPNVLDRLSNRKTSIWLNAKGDICYRFGITEKNHINIPSKASIAISNLLNIDITIGAKEQSTRSVVVTSNEPLPPMYLCINDLLLINDEEFRPDIKKEFFGKTSSNLVNRNTFQPSEYLLATSLTSPDTKNSTIGQYIFYLAGNDETKFHYIMDWLATFFQDFSKKSQHTLILIGKDTSGIDILFKEIIKPLFGELYCSTLNDGRLNSANLPDFINEKLFYNIDNISNESLSNKNIEKLLKNLVHNKEDLIDIQYKNTIVETKIFGQVLVTATSSNLPFVDSKNKNYTVFLVDNDIEKNFTPQVSIPDKRRKITKNELVNKIRQDLDNFSNILKCYISPPNIANVKDDKSSMIINDSDKLKAFCNAVVDKNIQYFEKLQDINRTFYNELIEDFDKNKIKQRNLLKCYNAIYTTDSVHSAKTLMVKLREINNSFFHKDSLQSMSGGTKYFVYNS